MARLMPRSPHSRNTRGRRRQRPVPGVLVGLLRADMERDAVGLEPELMGVLQHVRGHGGLAAELARQRPFGADAVGQDAAEHPGAGGGAGDLLDLGLAVDGVEPHAERVGPRDVALLLDGVAVADAVGRGAGREHHLDLGDRGGVEAGAEPGQQRQHLRRRVRLDGVEHPGVRQRLGEVLVVGAHDVEVDDEARAFVCAAFAALLRNSRMRAVIGALPKLRAAPPPDVMRVFEAAAGARWRRAGSETLVNPLSLPWFGLGRPRTARPARMDKPLRCHEPAGGDRQRPEKPAPSLL